MSHRGACRIHDCDCDLYRENPDHRGLPICFCGHHRNHHRFELAERGDA